MIWAFGEHELDEELYQLRWRGRPIRMEPRVFDVLLYLARQRERVVAKDELLDALWPGEATSDSVLPRCIAAARRALRDDRSRQRVIQTVHGRGYRFVAEVREVSGAKPAAGSLVRPGPAPESQGRADDRLVGREAVMSELRAALGHAVAGQGQVVLLAGEPGIGKTRTADALGAEAQGVGARWLVGRCYEGEGAPGFWPWLQVLRGLLDRAELADLMRETELRDAPGFDGEQVRFRVFDAIAERLSQAARQQPLVILLDDLHWADPDSLGLLQFLADALADAPILLLASYRDEEVRRDHPLRALLAALARQRRCRRIELRGLDPQDVASLIEDVTAVEPQGELAAAVAAMTEGNPFFVKEVARLLADEGRLVGEQPENLTLSLPQGVRDAIGQRLDSLSDACNALLQVAAVIGREFDTRLLERVADAQGESLLELLAEAEAAGILAESDGGPGRYLFRHALLRQTVYEELRAPHRITLHRRIGEALAAAFGERPDVPAARLAHHFFEALAAGTAAEAVTWCVRAAQRSHAALAYQESARHYRRALEAQDFSQAPDASERCELLIAWGDELRTAGEREAGRVPLAEAAELARQLGRADLLGRAAVAFRGFGEMGVPPEPSTLALLEEARDAVAGAHPLLRAQILARLAGTPPYGLSMATRRELSEEAWRLADGLDDPAVLTDALSARYWATLGPDRVAERLAVAREGRLLAQRLGDRRVGLIAHEIEVGAHLMLGDRRAVDDALAAYAALADALRQPVFQFLAGLMEASRAVNLGQFAEAEALIRKTYERGRGRVPFAELLFFGQMFWLLLQRGDLEQIAASVLEVGERLRARFSGVDAPIDVLISYSHAVSGDLEAARPGFDALAARGFGELERDEHWLLLMSMLAELAWRLGDPERGEALYALLIPYSDLFVSHDLLRTVSGSVQGVLGSLCLLLRRPADAAAHYEQALRMEEAMGALPALHTSQAGLAAALVARGDAGDRDRARALAAAAEAGTRGLGGRPRDVAQPARTT